MEIFPWYLWISSFSVQFIFIIFLDSLTSKYSQNIYRILLLIFFFLIFSGKLILSLHIGADENLYRVSIGKYINKLSHPEDILMLEPAGYIPYYANIKTIDEIGLVSREFTNFLSKKSPKESIVSFWIKYKPDFLVQRENILEFKDSFNTSFTKEESLWFKDNYCLNKHFTYAPKILAPKNKFKQFVLSLGSHSDYYLFIKNKEKNSCIEKK